MLTELYIPKEWEPSYIIIKTKHPIQREKTPYGLSDIFGPHLYNWKEYFGPETDEAYFCNINSEQSKCYVVWPQGQFAAEIPLSFIQNIEGNILVEVSEYLNMWSKLSKKYKKKPENTPEIPQEQEPISDSYIIHLIASKYVSEILNENVLDSGTKIEITSNDKFKGRKGEIKFRVGNYKNHYKCLLYKTKTDSEYTGVFTRSQFKVL